MTPQSRKARSEALLAARGIEINESLPPLESDGVALRTADELLERLVALWAVVGKAMIGKQSRHAGYIVKNKMQAWLSAAERRFILDKQPSKKDIVHFSWQIESLFFVAWCAGLVDAEEVPTTESSVQAILALFPQVAELPERLRAAITIRPLSFILDRADLLYRLDWAVHDDYAAQDDVGGAVVKQWRRAVNWVLRLGGEDDWDKLAAET